jgi:metal-responsive CopG/Arc/MetJ family transcriptional regulator
VKIAVSIPDPLFEAAEALARRRRISRSQLYAVALERLLAAQEDASITAQLDAIYSAHDSRVDPGLAAAQAAAVREAW